MTPNTADTILKGRFISYATPLEVARRWSRSGDPPDREQARKLLDGLFIRYPHSIEIAQQLALAYLEAGDDGRATEVLANIQLLCRNPNEEVLSRCGRIYRDRGDHFVTYPVFSGPPEIRIGGPTEIPGEARRYYLLALQEYEKAYKIRFGHYPGVNVATLHLLIAAFESNAAARESSLQASKTIARSLLDRKQEWPNESPDDAVWHAASAGEIHLLLHEWQAARDCYHAAQAHDKFQPFHRTSMLKQLIRIVYCQQRLGVPNRGAFDDLAQVFPPQTP